MVLLVAVPSLSLHPVVLSRGCSQSSEAVRTRRESERERGGKQHEEKSVSSHSNKYCNLGCHVWTFHCHRIYRWSATDRTERSQTDLVFKSLLFYSGWFCATCSLSAPGWQTLLPRFFMKWMNISLYCRFLGFGLHALCFKIKVCVSFFCIIV